MSGARVEIIAPEGFPLLQAGEPLFPALRDTLERNRLKPRDGDIFVIAQKIISKAEDRFVDLETVEPSKEAVQLAKECNKDARLVEVILRESETVVRAKSGVIIVRHKLGMVLANAGVDQSNVSAGDDRVLLLPSDPDHSAAAIRDQIRADYGADTAVIIADSVGRPWRLGTCGICIGCAGLSPLVDLRGKPDLYGRPLEVSEVAFGDELAAAASLMMGQADEARPLALVRGLEIASGSGGADLLLRPVEEDLFL
jgi:coenzyme F420-0:L-glutamate ligase/coenzyme F420-1:gamma-L-glutamate ligase